MFVVGSLASPGGLAYSRPEQEPWLYQIKCNLVK